MKNFPLVSSEELNANPEWRIFDCRHDLAKPEEGKDLYASGHIPGAVHAHLDNDLAGKKTGTNGRHPLPAIEDFTTWLGKAGVKRDDTIIAYDDAGGTFAARLWWILRWLGHESVAVLDGGYTGWVNAGNTPTETKPEFSKTVYKASINKALSVDVTEVEANLEDQRFQIIDARGANRYAGREEPIDPVAGHIPHALNRPCTENLNRDWSFKSAQTLQEEFQVLLGTTPPDAIVHQCGSGITACHNLLAMEIAGLHGSRLYAGSWSEWCSDAKRPVITE